MENSPYLTDILDTKQELICQSSRFKSIKVLINDFFNLLDRELAQDRVESALVAFQLIFDAGFNNLWNPSR